MRQQQQPSGEGIDRRGFLKLGASSTLALSMAGVGAALTGCSGASLPSQGYVFLRDADVIMLRALMPALLAGALPAETAARERLSAETLRRFDSMCARFEPPQQKLLFQLFDLLHLGITRRLTAGIAKPWNDVTEAEAEAFLNRWASSRVELYNAGYRAFAKISAVSYYAQPETWPQAGYPGPLSYVYAAVNTPDPVHEPEPVPEPAAPVPFSERTAT